MNGIARLFRESMTARFLIPLGLIAIVFSVLTFLSYQKTKNYPTTEAVVIRTELFEPAHTDSDGNTVEATYTVYLKYNVDGKDYEEEYGQFSGYNVGDKKTISYNPSNPKEISDKASIILPIILLVGGIVALAGGIISATKSIKKYKTMKKQEEGWQNGQ